MMCDRLFLPSLPRELFGGFMKRVLLIIAVLALTLSAVSCGQTCPPHFDADGDGVCDGCFVCVGQHTDSGCDGECDRCGAAVDIVHTEGNADGVCDGCGVSLVPNTVPSTPCDECVDGDGYCDICGNEMPDNTPSDDDTTSDGGADNGGDDTASGGGADNGGDDTTSDGGADDGGDDTTSGGGADDDGDDTTSDGGDTEVMRTPDPSDILSQDGSFTVSMTKLFDMSAHTDANGNYCRVLQGGCTDGTYYYAIFNDSLKTDADEHSPDSVSAICKYDIATGELVEVYENILVCHANDATYRPDTNEILISHCLPNGEIVSVFDADTMTLKKQMTAPAPIYSIAYDPYEKCYWAGLTDEGDAFIKINLDFEQVGEVYPGVTFGYTRQSVDVDSRYIYFSRYNPNCILVYDKAGNFVRRLSLNITALEVENVFHIGEDFYVGYYTASAGGRLYKLEIAAVGGTDEPECEMEEIFTIPKRTDDDGNVCKVAQCSATDGVYIYLMMNNDKSSGYVSTMYKYSIETGEIVATVDGFKTGHTNDMTYNSKTSELIVVHNNEPKLTVIDPATLTVKKVIDLEYEIFALAYDIVDDCYYATVKTTGVYSVVKVDLDFKLAGVSFDYINTGYSRQSMECDGEYIYLVQSAPNCILVYKKDGSFVGISYLAPGTNTAQSICHIGDTFYIGYNVSSSGGILYRATITIEEN